MKEKQGTGKFQREGSSYTLCWSGEGSLIMKYEHFNIYHTVT